VDTIKKHNSDASRTYDAAVNQFTDLTHEEFKQIYLSGLLPPADSKSNGNSQNSNLKQEVEVEDIEFPLVGACSTSSFLYDWSVTTSSNPSPSPVQNQGNCGSCYAFSSLAAMNTMTSIQKKVKVTYSTQ